MSKVSAKDRSYTLEELMTRIQQKAPHKHLSEHHRLPRSRGGNNTHTNTVRINRSMHFFWHTITRNQTGQEIADQWTEWWANGHIFQNHTPRTLLCCTIVRGTFTDLKLRGGYQTSKPSGKQQLAWNKLFGGGTPPEIVLQCINYFFVHPHSPLECGCERPLATS